MIVLELHLGVALLVITLGRFVLATQIASLLRVTTNTIKNRCKGTQLVSSESAILRVLR
jgi:hypothetical protein